MNLNEIFKDDNYVIEDNANISAVTDAQSRSTLRKMIEAFKKNDEITRNAMYNAYVNIELKHGICAMLKPDIRSAFFKGTMSECDILKIINKYLATLDCRQRYIAQKHLIYMLSL